MSIIFIADLHINESQPEIYQRFKQFIETKARNARALYILGDLFEYYLGDDVKSGVIQQVANDLSELSNQFGTKCYFMAGNRDFLIANDFCQGLEILPDPSVIELDDKKLILTHADELCTDDIDYQKARKQLRNPQWQAWFLNQTVSERIEFAKQARIQSQKHTREVNAEIMDVNAEVVTRLFLHFKTNLMLHGHTHRPAFHQYTVGNVLYQRMVLGDWHHQCSYIEYKNKCFQLITY